MKTFEVTRTCPCTQINAPSLLEHSKFVAWLNDEENPVATWHDKGQTLGEYSDVFIYKAKGRAGSDGGNNHPDDMPSDVWDSIIQVVGKRYTGMIWITFLRDD